MIIKVCGMRDCGNIRLAEQLDIDWMGFIFYPKSPRYVKNSLPVKNRMIKRVGVFVNESEDIILDISHKFRLDIVQLHGSETPFFCQRLKDKGLAVMKAFAVDTELPLSDMRRYGCCDYFLFDVRTTLYGGSGRKFNWNLLSDYDLDLPFLLSGGIGPEDADDILQLSHPRLFGIDLNSKFEVEPGIKDISLLQTFIKKLKK